MKLFKSTIIIPIIIQTFCVNFERNKQIDINKYNILEREEIIFIDPNSFKIFDCNLPEFDSNFQFFDTVRQMYIEHLVSLLSSQGYRVVDSDFGSDIKLKISLYQCELPPAGYVGLKQKNKFKEVNTIFTFGFLGLIPVIHYEPTDTYLTLEINENLNKIQKSFSIQLYGSGLVSIFYFPHFIFSGLSSIRKERMEFYMDSLVYLVINRHRIKHQL